MTTTREEALRATIAEFAGARFEFGSHDCCQFARRAAQGVLGRDPAAHLIYSSEDEADALIERHGGLAALLTSVFGEPVAADALQTADPCIVRLPMVGELVGVMSPGGVLVPMPVGLEIVPRSRALLGWSL